MLYFLFAFTQIKDITMSRTIIRNAHVISPDLNLKGATVILERGKIKSVSVEETTAAANDIVLDAKNALLVPGFIDVHLHGACGFDVCDAKEKGRAAVNPIEKIAQAKLEEGCTSFLPTTLTVARKTLLAAARNVAAYRKNEKYSKVIGLHLEGPYINVKCCGAQNPSFVRKPNLKEVLAISAISPVRMISYAPESQGGAEFAAACIKNKIVPSCGHTGAKLADLMPAYKKGLRHMTHFCNQMTPLHHREIGMVGAGFLIDDLNTELICDKIHLCPDMLRLIFAKRDINHIQMITDSLRCSHMADNFAFEMGGLKVILKNGEARLVEGGNLAGSTLWMNYGLKNLRDVTGLPLEQLIKVTSWNQARELGLGRKLGKIEKGFVADLALLDPKSFDVRAVFVNGEKRI